MTRLQADRRATALLILGCTLIALALTAALHAPAADGRRVELRTPPPGTITDHPRSIP